MASIIEIDAPDRTRTFPAYCAPSKAPCKAAVVVVQEKFGINADIRQQCQQLANAGYLAIAPDLFWRFAAGIELDPEIGSELAQAIELLSKFDDEQAMLDIVATVQAIRRMFGSDTRVGVVGHSLGGRLAFMAASRIDVNASVGYYGVGIDALLDEKTRITRPLMLHFARNDHLVDAHAQTRIHRALDNNAWTELHDYEGTDHGFATALGRRRAEGAAVLADERTARFLAHWLG
ncbi:dienelactone hydrolase family protein [Paraburkholderia caribensis]|uniref:dienelactone hydrolase family protein n=1 Tax=Paraburkholderia caribensis TaxID=75105 RepID=UPI00078D7171|nr:dienelactone hydrolase family protein [Paraburkholderia caribensis]AMV48278.1 carboxymethylenebutenolidase [Paraburkholderia caribensis]